MNRTSIHNVISLRMNMEEKEIETARGDIRQYKVIEIISEDANGHTTEITFFNVSSRPLNGVGCVFL